MMEMIGKVIDIILRPDSLVFYVFDWLTNSSTYMKIIPDERRKPGQRKPYEDYYRESWGPIA